MQAGTELKCIAPPNRYLRAGNRYEVAEILEMPGHAMVRKANGQWPKPGEPFFGMHPDECFESSPHGITALSCGYRYVDMEFFGVIVPNSVFPTPLISASCKPSPQTDYISDAVDSVELHSLWWRTFNNVLPKICIPDALERRFIILGIDHKRLGRQTSHRSAARAIKTVMRKLGISSIAMPPVVEHQVEFWTRSWRKAGPLTWRSRLI